MIWKSRFNQRIAQGIDFLVVFIANITAYYFWDWLYKYYDICYIPKPYNIDFRYIIITILISLIYVVIFNYNKAYNFQRFTSLSREYQIVLKVSILGLMIFIFISFMSGLRLEITRTYFIIFYVISVLLFLIEKCVMYYTASMVRQWFPKKKMIIVGTGKRTKHIIDIIDDNPGLAFQIIGIVTQDDHRVGDVIGKYEIIDTVSNFEKVISTYNPGEVVINLSTYSFSVIKKILQICEVEGIHVILNSDFMGTITKEMRIHNLFNLTVISFSMVKQSEFDLFMKRIIDIVGSIIALVFFSPFMIIAAIGILISDGRPIFYPWKIIGYDKKEVKGWKFRTMIKDADKMKEDLMKYNEMEFPVFKMSDDPRIFPFGRLLRKWSIDESPQFFSVLIGRLSLVGPRPIGPHEISHLTSWQRRKMSVKPGITCLWQVSGRNKINNFDDWIKLDLEYIDNWSIWLDLKIILKTILTVIKGQGK